MRGRKRSNWVADFETTTKLDDCRVWGWGLVNVETGETIDDVEIGTDLDSFMERISQSNEIVYFHNLKFDGTFMIDWLFRQGFTHTQDKPGMGQFTTLISSMGMFYTTVVAWENGKKTEFRCSVKKLPYSVAVIGEAFDLDVAKGEIDYHAERPVGHAITEDERYYIAMDVLVVSKALRMEFEAGMTRLTVGSDSLAEFKRLTGEKMFNRLFPVLSDSVDGDIRASYRGGFTYSDIRFRGRILGSGSTYDVNSLYPAVMYNSLLPFGEPLFRYGKPRPDDAYPLYIISITFTAKLRKNHIPCIQIKNNAHFSATEYLEEVHEVTTMSVTNVELELWEKHYDMNILSYNGGYYFRGKIGMFKSFIDKWMEIKENSEGGMRALAKLHLNALYGKFATNPVITPKIPVFEDDKVKYKLASRETKDPIYTAVGSFITAYARKITIDAAQENYPIFAYADTDSLHLMADTDPENLEVHPSELGKWKMEYRFDRALFVRAKTYIEEKRFKGTPYDYQLETHVAGLSVKVSKSLTLETFTSGESYKGNLKQKVVPGGVVLVDATFKLPVW